MLSKKHDKFFKEVFSVKENLLDLLQGTLPREVLNGIHPETLEYDPTEYVDNKLAPHFRDIACNMLYGDQKIKISLLLEHKSYPAKNIHLQLLRYILNVWEHQQVNKQELTPVICIVFYHGQRRWSRREMVKDIPEELRPFVPRFDYVLIDTVAIEDNTIIQKFRQPNVRIGMWFLKRHNNLIGFMQDNPALTRELLREIRTIEENNREGILIYLCEVSGLEPEITEKIMGTISPEAKSAFEEYRIRLIEQGIEKGRVEGIEQGLKKTALNMIARGDTDEQIAEVTNLSIKLIKELRQEHAV
jgi:predicted transposase/invertase (TIGR01784 family)